MTTAKHLFLTFIEIYNYTNSNNGRYLFGETCNICYSHLHIHAIESRSKWKRIAIITFIRRCWIVAWYDRVWYNFPFLNTVKYGTWFGLLIQLISRRFRFERLVKIYDGNPEDMLVCYCDKWYHLFNDVFSRNYYFTSIRMTAKL